VFSHTPLKELLSFYLKAVNAIRLLPQGRLMFEAG